MKETSIGSLAKAAERGRQVTSQGPSEQPPTCFSNTLKPAASLACMSLEARFICNSHLVFSF